MKGLFVALVAAALLPGAGAGAPTHEASQPLAHGCTRVGGTIAGWTDFNLSVLHIHGRDLRLENRIAATTRVSIVAGHWKRSVTLAGIGATAEVHLPRHVSSIRVTANHSGTVIYACDSGPRRAATRI